MENTRGLKLSDTQIEVFDTTFEDEVFACGEPILVVFHWLAGCHYSKENYPVMKDIANWKPELRVLYYDTDKNKVLAIANRYKIDHVPTIILFVEGQPVWRHEGLITKKDLQAALDQRLTPEHFQY